jgi:hypothetical protein
LIVLNEKWVNSKKKKMSRGIVSSEGTAQKENRRRETRWTEQKQSRMTEDMIQRKPVE